MACDNVQPTRYSPARRIAAGHSAAWGPSNARELLQWTIDHGYYDLLFAVELGNEQNTAYTAAEHAANARLLYDLTRELWGEGVMAGSRPKLVGPDPHSFKDNEANYPALLDWMSDYLTTAAGASAECTGRPRRYSRGPTDAY